MTETEFISSQITSENHLQSQPGQKINQISIQNFHICNSNGCGDGDDCGGTKVAVKGTTTFTSPMMMEEKQNFPFTSNVCTSNSGIATKFKNELQPSFSLENSLLSLNYSPHCDTLLSNNGVDGVNFEYSTASSSTSSSSSSNCFPLQGNNNNNNQNQETLHLQIDKQQVQGKVAAARKNSKDAFHTDKSSLYSTTSRRSSVKERPSQQSKTAAYRNLSKSEIKFSIKNALTSRILSNARAAAAASFNNQQQNLPNHEEASKNIFHAKKATLPGQNVDFSGKSFPHSLVDDNHLHHQSFSLENHQSENRNSYHSLSYVRGKKLLPPCSSDDFFNHQSKIEIGAISIFASSKEERFECDFFTGDEDHSRLQSEPQQKLDIVVTEAENGFNAANSHPQKEFDAAINHSKQEFDAANSHHQQQSIPSFSHPQQQSIPSFNHPQQQSNSFVNNSKKSDIPIRRPQSDHDDDISIDILHSDEEPEKKRTLRKRKPFPKVNYTFESSSSTSSSSYSEEEEEPDHFQDVVLLKNVKKCASTQIGAACGENTKNSHIHSIGRKLYFLLLVSRKSRLLYFPALNNFDNVMPIEKNIAH